MPLDYTSDSGETLSLDYAVDDNGNQILPANKEINKVDQIDSLGEKYRKIVEFDLNSEEAYDSIVSSYPDAWDEYFGGNSGAPDYSFENAVKLQEALAFYLYVSDGETYDAVPVEESIDFAPYIREEGSSTGTYENPDAFYDPDVYDRVTNGGSDPVPRVDLNGGRTVSSSLDSGRDVDYSELYSAEQLNSTEYETVRNGPKSFYDWGSFYSTGKKTY